MALGKSLAEIDALPASEVREWQEYDHLFPFGDERADWRMGTIVAAQVNTSTRGKRYQASDFMLQPPKTPKQRDAGLRAALRTAGKRRPKG